MPVRAMVFPVTTVFVQGPGPQGGKYYLPVLQQWLNVVEYNALPLLGGPFQVCLHMKLVVILPDLDVSTSSVLKWYARRINE
jgi:hypothetical protein